MGTLLEGMPFSDESECVARSQVIPGQECYDRPTRVRALPRGVFPCVAFSSRLESVSIAPLVITAPGALEAARSQGFMEAVFPCIDAERESTQEEIDSDDFAVWGRECVANDRHAVIVGALPDDFFLVMLIRRYDPDMQYVLEDMREAFRAAFGQEPEVDT